MDTVSASVNIDAPPEKVFAILSDVERWPEWTPTMTCVQRLDGGSLALGSSARVRQPKLRPNIWKVTEFAAQRSFTWSTRSLGLRMTAGHLIAPVGAGSRVTLSFELSGMLAPLVSRLYGVLIEQYVTAESQGLKERSERKQP